MICRKDDYKPNYQISHTSILKILTFLKYFVLNIQNNWISLVPNGGYT